MFSFIIFILVLASAIFLWKNKSKVKLPDLSIRLNNAKDHSASISGDHNSVHISHDDYSTINTTNINETNINATNNNSSSNSTEGSLGFLVIAFVGLAFLFFLLGVYLKLEYLYNIQTWLFVVTTLFATLNILIYYFKTNSIPVTYSLITIVIAIMIYICIYRAFNVIDYKPLQQELINFATAGNNVKPLDIIRSKEYQLPFMFLLFNITFSYTLILFLLFESFSIAKGKSLITGKGFGTFLILLIIFFIMGSGLFIPICSWFVKHLKNIGDSISAFFKDLHATKVNVD